MIKYYNNMLKKNLSYIAIISIVIILFSFHVNIFSWVGGVSGQHRSYSTFNNTIAVINTKDFNLSDTDIKSISIVEKPSNGSILQDREFIKYSPHKDFIGTDQFSFHVNKPNSTLFYVDMIISPHSPYVPILFPSDPQLRAGVSFFISFIFIIVIIFAFTTIISYLRERKLRFSDIIRTADYDPSLSLFQFFLWTIIIIFSFFGIYVARFFSGVFEPLPGGIPGGILQLMGISIASPFISSYITKIKEIPSAKNKESLSSMLTELDKLSLSRFQLFAWTWVSVIIYLVLVFSEVTIKIRTEPQNMSLPNIDPILVILMGLSHTAFLGGKATVKYPIDKPIDEPSSSKGA